MEPQDLSVLISRIDFAWVSTFHIIYPPLTIGLATVLFVFEALWVRTGNEHWYRLCRFFERLFIVNFGAGVATGVTMEMAFGILYGPFSQAAGPFFGQVLGYETITAFMYEAGFIGLMVFGWGKISRGMHLFATFNVALSSSISAMWILVANSWMQTPTGVKLQDGFFMVTDWLAALLNPNALVAFPHMLLACIELSLCFVAAVSAWQILKGRHVALFQRPLKISIIALFFVATAQIGMGDMLGENVLHDKPAALAAMEGHYDTYDKDGQVNSAWHIIGWPNKDGTGLAWSISIPHALSMIETKTWDDPVTGLNSFAPEDRPPVVIPFYAFRVMVAAGGVIFLVALWGVWLMARKRMSVDQITTQTWFLRTVIAMGAVPYFAITAGWWTREVARQPWVVYGLMRTEDGVSQMSVPLALFWLIGFAVFETAVLAGTIYYIFKVCRHGPDMDSPVIGEGHEQLGELHTNDANEHFVRPV